MIIRRRAGLRASRLEAEAPNRLADQLLREHEALRVHPRSVLVEAAPSVSIFAINAWNLRGSPPDVSGTSIWDRGGDSDYRDHVLEVRLAGGLR